MEHEKKSAQWSERKGDLLSELRVLPIFIRLIKTDKDGKFIMEHGADKNSGYEGRHIYADDLESAKQKALYVAIEAASKTLADLVAQSNDDHLITMILILKRAMDLSVKLNTMRASNNFESGGIVTNEHSESGEYIVPVHKEFSGTMQPDPNIPPVKGILDIIKNDANTPVIKFVLKNGVLNLLDDEIYLSMPFEDGKIFYTNSQLRSDYKIKNLSLKNAHTIAKDAFEYVCQFSRTNGVASKYPIKGPVCYEYCVQAKKSGQMVRIYKFEEVNEAPIKFTLNGNVLSIFDNDFPYTIQRGYIKRCIKHEVNNVPTFLECDFFYNNGDISTFTVSDERTYFYCSEAAEKALQVIICTKQESDETNTSEH